MPMYWNLKFYMHTVPQQKPWTQVIGTEHIMQKFKPRIPIYKASGLSTQCMEAIQNHTLFYPP